MQGPGGHRDGRRLEDGVLEELLKKAVEQFFVQMELENGRSDPKYAPTYGVSSLVRPLHTTSGWR